MNIANLIGLDGRILANQFVLSTSSTKKLQSYNNIIASINKSGAITLDCNYWDYSEMTIRCIKIFLDTTISTEEIQARIDSGEYLTAKLN